MTVIEWGPILTIMLPIFGTATLGIFIWSVQRIIGRIDKLGDKLEAVATRVAVIESKQDTAVEVAVRADRVGRKTANKVGVRLPRDLTDTIDPARLRTS
jgi:hypothetical protein